ncbi:MAG: hypothetical protein H7Z38_10210 [Rubrivivax sp.]|nr:hypothetical protein [Pyrinomonadaceae bacterium]
MARALARKVAPRARFIAALFAVALCAPTAFAQAKPQDEAQAKPGAQSEHDTHILGVRPGMSVPDALKAVFEHTATAPAPQRPDGLKEEGKEKKDIRVVYKNLKEGELQIVFAGGKSGFVREVTLTYAKQPTVSDLRLPQTGSIASSGNVLDSALNSGERYDNRYTIGFTDNRKTERFWWRDEQAKEGYSIRIGFVSGKLSSGGAMADSVIVRKVLMVKPGEEAKFWKAVEPS